MTPDPTPKETAELRERVVRHARKARQDGVETELFRFMGGPLDGIDVALKRIARRAGHEDEASIGVVLDRPRGIVEVSYQAEGDVWRYRGTESPQESMGKG